MANRRSSSRKPASPTLNSLTSAFQPLKSSSSSSSSSSTPSIHKHSSKHSKQKTNRDADSQSDNQQRLRKPKKAELNSIKLAAEAASKLKHNNPSTSKSASASTSNNHHDDHLRASTPPPSFSSSSPSSSSNKRPQSIGNPPSTNTTSSPSLLGSPGSLDLFEPTKRSPVSVREDPDTGKLYLMMSNSRLKAAVAGPSRLISTTSRGGLDSKADGEQDGTSSSSSPRKRKLDNDVDSDLNSSPSCNRASKKKMNDSSPTPLIDTSTFPSTSAASTIPSTTPKNQTTSSIGLGLSYSNKDATEDEDEEEDEFILRPGQNKGKRVSLGSPKGLEDPNLKLKAKAKAQAVNQQQLASHPSSSSSSSPSSSSPSHATKASEKLRLKELRREDEMDLGMGSEIESDESQGQTVGDEQMEDRMKREDSEELVITPRDVRERPAGIGVSPASYATPSKAAKFKASSRLGSSSSSSSSSSHQLFKSGSSIAETSSGSTGEPLDEPASTVNHQPTSTPLPPLPSDISLSSSLPLPPHYSTILTLHNALEHSLVVHLATAGTSSSSIDSLKLSQDNDRERSISIPNLITYTNLRPIVESACGRRLGTSEFSKLVAIWAEGEDHAEEESSMMKKEDEIRGLGFIVNKTRSLDPKTGKKVWDWGIGIELKVILPPKRQVTPPIQVSFGNAPSTPPSKSNSNSGSNSVQNSPYLASDGFSSPSKRSSSGNGREGMSIIALWHNGIEFRKNQVARRLQERCGRFHQAWLNSRNGETVPTGHEKESQGLSTPSRKGKQREVSVGEGGLLTPAATRENGRRKGARVVHFEMEEKDGNQGESDDEDVGDVTLMPSSDSDFNSTSNRSRSPLPETPVKSRLSKASAVEGNEQTRGDIKEWHPSFNLNSVSPLPLAKLPSLKESPKINQIASGNLSKSIADQMAQFRQGQSSSQSDPNPAIPKTPSSSSSSAPGAKLSLAERIKAKEDAKKAELQRIQAQRFGFGLGLGSKKSASSSRSAKSSKELEMENQANLMQGYKRRAILSRLSDVADAIYMLFTTKSSTISINGDASSSPSPSSRRHSPTISVSEILNTISKSSKTSFSRVEARLALDILIEISPGFLELIKVGDREWARLGEGRKLNEGCSGIGLRECKSRIARELVAPGAGRK